MRSYKITSRFVLKHHKHRVSSRAHAAAARDDFPRFMSPPLCRHHHTGARHASAPLHAASRPRRCARRHAVVHAIRFHAMPSSLLFHAVLSPLGTPRPATPVHRLSGREVKYFYAKKRAFIMPCRHARVLLNNDTMSGVLPRAARHTPRRHEAP